MDPQPNNEEAYVAPLASHDESVEEEVLPLELLSLPPGNGEHGAEEGGGRDAQEDDVGGGAPVEIVGPPSSDRGNNELPPPSRGGEDDDSSVPEDEGTSHRNDSYPAATEPVFVPIPPRVAEQYDRAEHPHDAAALDAATDQEDQDGGAAHNRNGRYYSPGPAKEIADYEFRDGSLLDDDHVVVGGGSGEEDDAIHDYDDTTSQSTDNLSGISDPIGDLTQTPRSSPRKPSGTATREGGGGGGSGSGSGSSPRASSEASYNSGGPTTTTGSPRGASIPEEERLYDEVEGNHIPDAGGSDTVADGRNGVGDGKRMEAHPSSSAAPLEGEGGEEVEGTSDDRRDNVGDAGALGKDAKEYNNWEESLASPDGAASPEAACANLFFSDDDDSDIVHPDADRIAMLEDTDMRPRMSEPELDGEPVFVFDNGSDPDDDGNNVIHSSTFDEGSSSNAPIPTGGKAPELESARSAGHSSAPLQDEASIDTALLAESHSHSEARQGDLLREGSSMRSLQSLPSDLPPNASSTPNATPVLASGSILTRSSLRSLVMKKWHPNHWVRYGPTSMYIFRSRDDFVDWLENPYHTQKQREYLIKFRLDFYNDMKKSNTRGFKMTEIKVKIYEKKDGPMYNFKLERWSDLGVSVVAAFASADLKEVKAVHAAISRCLEMCPDNGLRSIDDLVVNTEKAL